jgi:hypothetical protein
MEDEEFSITTGVGVHDLCLQLLNKTPEDTVVDAQGKVIEDLYVVLKSLQIDGFDISLDDLNHISEYRDPSGQEAKTFGWLVFPTPFNVLFQSPGWYFKRNLTVLPKEDIYGYLANLNRCQKIHNK